ncbi:IS630 family transposase [Deltaproteobacteria bacterium TL4]
MKSKRDEEHFREAQQDMEILKHEDDLGTIDLYYFDGSGFTGVPEVPYAWQDPDDPILLPSEKTRRINALGFMNRKSDLFAYTFENSINSEVVVACFDEFVTTLDKTTIVVLDNAPIHHSGWFDSQIERWEEEGLYLYFLPTYSPELNLIEILWKHIKYYWLSLSAYLSFDALRKEVDRVLANVGIEYKIQFT